MGQSRASRGEERLFSNKCEAPLTMGAYERQNAQGGYHGSLVAGIRVHSVHIST
jgi:hypothetical protein